MFSRLRHLRLFQKNVLVRNTGWMIIGLGLKLLIQALYFTVIARSLGAQNYGAFVGVVGLVGIASPFAALGSGNLLVKNVARDARQFPKNCGLALLTTLASSSILFAVIVLVSRFLLPSVIPLRLVMFVAASDLFGTSMITICAQMFLAFERLAWTAAINVLISSARLTAAVILVTLHHTPSALQWAGCYFGSTSVVAIAALGMVFVKLGVPVFDVSRTAAEFREGVYFSVSQSAETIYNDIDKAMLVRLGTLQATGIYGAAYRLIDVSFAPVASLLAAAYAGFFRAGTGGISETIRYAKPLLLRALGYAAFVAVALLAGAGIIPYILGGDYRLSVEAVRWLAILPVLKVLHFFLSDALTGAGYQGLKTLIHVAVAVFNSVINLWIIPAYSWRGAAWSSIASDALLTCGIGTAVLLLSRRSRPAIANVEAFEMRAEA